ncbi:MAG: RluA family pseudouridine synthase [Bacteroidota bacterium]
MLIEKEHPERTEWLLVVPEGQNKEIRLDKYITSFIENASRTKVQKAIKDGHVLVNGTLEKASYILMPNDRIDISLPKPPPPEVRPEKMDLDIVYEDESLLVVNKPAGMVVHPAFGNWDGTLVNGLMYHTQEGLSEPEADTIRPGIVHRLDKDTSGLLVVAKDDGVHTDLSKQFAEKSVDRTYQAIVWGRPPEEGTIDKSVGRSPQDRKVMAIRPEGKGKSAVTHYRVLEVFDYLSLVEIRLETGRTHQIRVHMQSEGYYVFGDSVYGGDSVRYGQNTGSRKAMFQRLFRVLSRQALHAKTLGFDHPVRKERVRFDSELPEDFREVLETLRKNCPAESVAGR